MKSNISTGLIGLALAGSAAAQGLYYVGNEAQESIPLKWVVGANLTYDDNISPGTGPKEDSLGTNPYVGLSFVTITPQTTWDVYARLGLIYYFDSPDYMDDVNSSSRAGFNLTHRFNERLRFSSRNFIAYELEPDYSYGYASSRQTGDYFYWSTDNSIGYRWSERIATYSGFNLTGANYDSANNDRYSWTLYNQFRYQASPQTVLTFDYRYSQTYGNGASSDAVDQYILVGAEHRFSPNTIGIIRGGIQLHDVEAQSGNSDSDTSSPYLELALNSQVNQQFSVRAFARYGIENYNTVQTVQVGPVTNIPVEFNDLTTLRIGVSSEYVVSPVFSIYGGIDYIPSDYSGGQSLPPSPPGPVGDYSEDILNLYIGMSAKINDFLTGTLTYNYTDSSSDFVGQTYDRNRISVGLSAEF